MGETLTDAYDVVVLGSGAAGAHRCACRRGRWRTGRAVREGVAARWDDGALQRSRLAPGQLGCGRSRRRGLARRGAGLSRLPLARHDLPEFAETFVGSVGDLIEWLETRTPLHLRLVPGFPDYHPERPGGKPHGGRSLEPELFSYDELGPWADRIVGRTRPMYVTETPTGGGTGFLDPQVEADRRNRRIEGLGRALLGALLKGCLQHDVAITLEARATRLLRDGARVTGVVFDTPAGPQAVAATRGVVMATGGFEWDDVLVRDFCADRCAIRPAFHRTPATVCAWPCG